MSTEIPIWVNGKIRWLSGIDKKTTCKDVVEVLLNGEGIDKSEVKDFTIIERWRKVERPLDENSRILRIWSHWGNEKKEVRLCLRRIDNEVDSGRGSPIPSGNTPSLRRKRNRYRGSGKPPWTHPETLHPRRLAELGKFCKKEYNEYHLRKVMQEDVNDDCDRENKHCNYEQIYDRIENANNRKKSGHKSYHCSNTGKLHSTLLTDNSNVENHPKRTSKCCSKRESKQKIRNSENIEKLMKLILAQGATIQSQLQKLKERDEQIESIEHERHRDRIEKNGRNYLLETYLGSLKDAEIPEEMEEEKGNDSGVHTEGGSDQINSVVKNENTERLKQNETESHSDRGCKGIEREHLRPGHRAEVKSSRSSAHYSLLNSHQKGARSKSESRTHECKTEDNLKRTLSDNAIAEASGVDVSDKDKKTFSESVEDNINENAKEDSEEVVELRRIQSQIEMWEKVFKINKKLEKEEENLVRLHIRVKKFQSENYRLAKERKETNNEVEQSDDYGEIKERREGSDQAQDDCVEIQKSLEDLRSVLEQNSKEIYRNFTSLMEGDEIVERKRNCLTKLISDLERTDHEHEMLEEMLAMREKQQPDHIQNASYVRLDNNTAENNLREFPNDAPLDVEMKPFESNFQDVGVPIITQSTNCSNSLVLPHKPQEVMSQRTEIDGAEQDKMQPMKPKIVKISFEDQNVNCVSSEIGQEKVLKDPVPVGALKGILKNRKYNCDKDTEKLNTNNEFQESQKSSQGYIPNTEKPHQRIYDPNIGHIQKQYPHMSEVPEQNSAYPYTVLPPLYNHYPHENTQNYFQPVPLNKISEELKTAYPVKNSHIPGISRVSTNMFPHSTIVTTKAVVHNDTDSSTSSDTSGLSSMYSSSPTVEEPFIEQPYVLDTLV